MAWNTKNGGVIQLFTSESLRRINAALLPFLFSPLHGGCRFYACFAVLLPREITPHGETASSLSVPPQFLLAGASSSATLSSSLLQVLLSREITPHGETASSLSVPPQFLLAGTPRLRRSPPGDRLYGLGALRRGGPCRDRWLQELFHECNGSSSPGLNCPILCMESSGRENRSFTYSLHRMIRLVLFRIGEQARLLQVPWNTYCVASGREAFSCMPSSPNGIAFTNRRSEGSPAPASGRKMKAQTVHKSELMMVRRFIISILQPYSIKVACSSCLLLL